MRRLQLAPVLVVLVVLHRTWRNLLVAVCRQVMLWAVALEQVAARLRLVVINSRAVAARVESLLT